MRSLRATATSLALLVVLPSARAQTYDFSAVTALFTNNVALYQGGVFVQVFQDDREIYSFQGLAEMPVTFPPGTPRKFYRAKFATP